MAHLLSQRGASCPLSTSLTIRFAIVGVRIAEESQLAQPCGYQCMLRGKLTSREFITHGKAYDSQ